MKKILLLLILGALAWNGYQKYLQKTDGVAVFKEAIAELPSIPVLHPASDQPQSYACDGRTYCSQMKSCEEAKYFLKNCPDVKMDGNNDGVPCEKQWCLPF